MSSLSQSEPADSQPQLEEQESAIAALQRLLRDRASAAGQVVVESSERPRSYVKRAAQAAWFPLYGVWYFARHREFYPLFASRLLPLSLISLLVYFLLFTFTFLPQFAFLAIWQGWNAWFSTVVLVLGEGLVIIQVGQQTHRCRKIRPWSMAVADLKSTRRASSKASLWTNVVSMSSMSVRNLHCRIAPVSCLLTNPQATLLNFGLDYLLAPHRVLFSDAPDSVKKLGKPTSPAIYQPWSLKQMAELVFFLPLNFIPWVGTPAFIIITGTRLGKLSHYRWQQLRGLNREERKRDTESRTWEYMWFGTVAMILELVPVFSLFFLLTTTAGAALWVADMEEDRKRMIDALERGQARDDRAPVRYRD